MTINAMLNAVPDALPSALPNALRYQSGFGNELLVKRLRVHCRRDETVRSDRRTTCTPNCCQAPRLPRRALTTGAPGCIGASPQR